MITANAFVTRLGFLPEKRNKAYNKYVAMSIARKKVNIVQKAPQSRQLRWMAGSAGA
jgi:hypothetical protein